MREPKNSGHCHRWHQPVPQVHAYERWDPQLNYTYNECGPVHITIGDGGNVEGVRPA